MEFDILNDIITQTVNEFLIDQPSVQELQKKDFGSKRSVDNQSRDFSRGSREDRLSTGTFLTRGDSIKSENATKLEKAQVLSPQPFLLQRQAEKKQSAPAIKQDCSVGEWLRLNAPILLEESLKKLNLTTSVIETRNLDLLSKDDLNDEKKRVKNELKRYDSYFFSSYNRFPSRDEKEPMRPLYIYYKNLKQAITRAENSRGGTRGRAASTPVQKAEPVPSKEELKQEPIKRLERLKKKRGELRRKLEDYQTEFVRNHNRKIKYRQDIIDVEEDYNLYKSLKEEIHELEKKLKEG